MGNAASAQALASQGNGRGAPPCQSCHGTDGGGQAAAGFPRLAGLDAAYLARQLEDYAEGSRASAVMQPIARALSARERDAVAGYYAQLPVAAMPAAPKPAADGAGATLATRGRWSEQVPACEQCHGPGGVGVGAHFPPLAGQPAAYIESQLKAWQQGSRRNDPLELMQHLSRALSAEDIAAVAQWFAAQPLPAAKVGK
ncbi:c-type cytochrome [Frateuria hangzhouensis]|uniref:c-type cytochrome n=1 Tax=Frateuria hangzhouensis TaxID=2995589 RepID=UPI002260A858|nr:c-type cytochrome [Frateuria sp. STR12]MCX7513166.1 c-type cytochrome [Frateuria sp. STR12]